MHKNAVELTQKCEQIIDTLIDIGTEGTNILLNMNIWDWSQGVGLYGIYKYYRYSRNTKYFDYLIDWFESKMPDEDKIMKNVNTMAPLLTLAHLYEDTQKQEYLDFCIRWADLVVNEMPRTDEGGVQHITIDALNTQQLWADTLFMTALFMAKIGQVTHNPVYQNEAIKQFMVHIKYLQDRHTGLLFHGWTFDGHHNFGEACWCRGNCWFTAATMELLDFIDIPAASRDFIVDGYKGQCAALKKYQHESGLFHTLVDDPTSYLETSGSAGFIYGLLKGVRKGVLDESYLPVVEKGVEGLLKEIGPDGIVTNASYGTVVHMTKEYYKNIRLTSTGYGQSLTLLVLTELLYH